MAQLTIHSCNHVIRFFKRPAKGDAERTLWTMAFTPILMFQLAYATGKTGVQNRKYEIYFEHNHVPDGVEGGEPLLNGVRGPGGLPVRISNAHRDRETILSLSRWKILIK